METIMRAEPTPGSDTHHAAEPLVLPFDDGSDEAVPYVLTAAAHREVLGRDVPPLVVVPRPAPASSSVGGVAVPVSVEDGTSDARRAQARALLHSGMPVATIAAALGVEVGLVERWTADLVDELARRRRRTGRRGHGAAAPPSAVSAAVPAHAPADALADASADAPVERSQRERLLPGLAFAVTEVDGDTVILAHDRLEPVALVLDALRALGDVPTARMRVAVRLAPDLPADRTRAAVAARLGVDAATLTVGRSGPGVHRGMELRVDLRDAACAAQVRAWRDGDRELRGWDSNPQTFRLTADCSAS
jgi:hypothetical protein